MKRIPAASGISSNRRRCFSASHKATETSCYSTWISASSLIGINVIIADLSFVFNAKIMETKEKHDTEEPDPVKGECMDNKLFLSVTIVFLYWTNICLYAMIESYQTGHDKPKTER